MYVILSAIWHLIDRADNLVYMYCTDKIYNTLRVEHMRKGCLDIGKIIVTTKMTNFDAGHIVCGAKEKLEQNIEIDIHELDIAWSINDKHVLLTSVDKEVIDSPTIMKWFAKVFAHLTLCSKITLLNCHNITIS